MFNYRDQADGLRRIMAKTSARMISVIGANGQPVTPWMNNLALSLLGPEQRFLLIHGHRQPTVAHSLQQIVANNHSTKRAITRHPQGYDLCCLAENDLLTSPLSQDLKTQLDGIVRQLAYDYDTVLMETQLDAQEHHLALPVSAEHELVIQMDRSDTAIKAAYVTIKHISQHYGQLPLGIVVTGANQDQGQQYFMRLNQVCKQFLGVTLTFLGAIPAEQPLPVATAARHVKPELPKHNPTTLAFKSVAHRLEKQRITTPSLAVA